MELFKKQKFALLLCMVMTIVVTRVSFAENESSIKWNFTPLSQKITEIQRLISIEKQSDKTVKFRTTQWPSKNQFKIDVKVKSLVGPGLDGGGGETVLTTNGQLRLLDMALDEKLDLAPFDDRSYSQLLLKDGRYVVPSTDLITNEDFFRCADHFFAQQENPFLRYLVSANLELSVVKTHLPFQLKSGDAISAKYRENSGWVHEVLPLPAKILASRSAPQSYQRPVASYAVQSTNSLVPFSSSQTLIVSSQLYESLPQRDQCALQVHEILRYVSYFGHVKDFPASSTFYLLKRPLETQEIEKLTQKIMKGDRVLLSEFPATGLLKLFALVGPEVLAKMNAEELRSLHQSLLESGVLSDIETNENDESKSTLLTSVILYKMQIRAKASGVVAESMLTQENNRNTRGFAMRIRNQNKIKMEKIDLLPLLTDK